MAKRIRSFSCKEAAEGAGMLDLLKIGLEIGQKYRAQR